MPKIKNKVLILILTVFMAVLGIYAGAVAPAKASSEAISSEIITVTPGAKAEDGKLSFHYWINKRLLTEYALTIPLTHTYLNVLINGEVQLDRAYCVEGFQYVEWQHNVSNDANSGYGQFVVTVDVIEHLTDNITVVFGFTDTGENHIDLFSDTVTYTDVYYSDNGLESLKIQISFLKSELARLNAESVTNYEAYEEVSGKLERLQAEYDVLKEEYDQVQAEEKIKAYGVIIAFSIISLIIVALAIFISIKTAKGKLKLFFKILIELIIIGAIFTFGYFGVSEILTIVSGAL